MKLTSLFTSNGRALIRCSLRLLLAEFRIALTHGGEGKIRPVVNRWWMIQGSLAAGVIRGSSVPSGNYYREMLARLAALAERDRLRPWSGDGIGSRRCSEMARKWAFSNQNRTGFWASTRSPCPEPRWRTGCLKELELVQNGAAEFRFLDPGELRDDAIMLRLVATQAADP